MKGLAAAVRKDEFWGVAPYERPSAEEVADTQRKRLLLGITRAVARKGYAAASVADVLKEVRVSRRTFYEMFKDKEGCYLAAYDLAHDATIDHIKLSQRGVTETYDRIERAHQAYLEFIVRHPELAKAFSVGVLEAGERANERRQRAFQEFADLHAVLHRQCREQHPEILEVPRLALVALSAGTNIIVVDELRRRGASKIMALLPVILHLSCSVYGLPQLASRFLARS